MTNGPSPCPICDATRTVAFRSTLLGRHLVAYHSCSECGLLQTEKPFWLAEAYGEPIAVTDTGLMARNLQIGVSLRYLYTCFIRSRGPYLDVAGGYGLLTRYLRDQGLECFWSDAYAKNLVASGFEWKKSRPCAAVSAIEVLEHVEDPLGFVREALGEAGCSSIVLTTVLFDGEPPAPDWWYYSAVTGQHISFYQRRTLLRIAEILGLRLYSRGSLHLLTDRRRPAWLFNLVGSPLAPLIGAMAVRRLTSLTEPDHLAMSAALTRGQTAEE